jgi:tRNA(Ile)-lysidine synthase
VTDGVAAALDAHAEDFSAATRLCVALSGGLDSTVLLTAITERWAGRVMALHANHGLHGDAHRWAAHCADLCAQLGVPLRSAALTLHDEGRGLEAAARAARYAWFEAQLDPGDLLLLAHHRDDQAETLLLRLLRGAGPDGLAGMPRSRPIGPARLLRPFLDLPRRELERHARDRGLAWLDDPSNADLRFDRNFLRHRVLPVISERWPGSAATLARAAALLGEAAEDQAVEAPPDVLSVVGDPGFAIEALGHEEVKARRALRAWLRRHCLPAPSAVRLGEFLRQLREGRGAEASIGGVRLQRFREAVFVVPRVCDPGLVDQPFAVGQRAELAGVGSIALQAVNTADATLPPLRLRLRRGGERLPVAGGQHRDLKQVFQDSGLPPWWRARVPLLFDATPGREELLAVGDLARSPRCRGLGLRLAWRPPVAEGGPAGQTD